MRKSNDKIFCANMHKILKPHCEKYGEAKLHHVEKASFEKTNKLSV